jgi:hypothetical protein
MQQLLALLLELRQHLLLLPVQLLKLEATRLASILLIRLLLLLLLLVDLLVLHRRLAVSRPRVTGQHHLLLLPLLLL